MITSNFFESTKVVELGSCAFRQWRATHSHCKYIHGYQLKAKLWFRGPLDDRNWVVDFGGLDDLKRQLRYQFDHTTCVASDDPYLEKFKELDALGIIQLRIMPGGVGIERTAEFVQQTADSFIRNLTHNRCWCERVEVFEHEDNSALFVSTPVEMRSEIILTEDTPVYVTESPTTGDPIEYMPSTTSDDPQNRAAPLYCKTDKSLADILTGR